MSSSRILQEATIETDVVVVGGGGAGLAAAVAAAEKGARVVLLEKSGIGGNSALAWGVFAADSLVQKSLNIVARPDQVVRKALEYSHWTIDQRLFRTFVNKSADTVQWLEDKGLSFQVPPVFPGQDPRTWHVVDGAGAKLVKTLRKNCEDLGVNLLIRCPAEKILTNEAGEVTGVLATQNGKQFRVNAKSVIIATGGYGGNKDLMKKYVPDYKETLQNGGLNLTGDGLLMALEIGAATEGLGYIMLHPQVYAGNKHHGHDSMFAWIVEDPRGIWVNKKGERFTDEGISLRYHECGNVVNRQLGGVVYSLWDEAVKDLVKCEGTGKHPLASTRGLGSELNNLDRDLRAEAEKGEIKISHSWDEIAKWMGVAPQVLKATVDEYNSACDRGFDDIFAKDRGYLRALRTPPYYAIKCYPSFLTTMGGIKIDYRMQVLNQQLDPIPGLYAGGDTAGGWESETYCMDLAGSAFGFAVNSGRIAGENAAEYVRKGA